jgi:hypothetical protein
VDEWIRRIYKVRMVRRLRWGYSVGGDRGVRRVRRDRRVRKVRWVKSA